MKAKFDLNAFFTHEIQRSDENPITGMYIKADGSERLFEGTLNSTRDVVGEGRSCIETFTETNTIPYFDTGVNAWRSFDLGRLRRFVLNGVEFEITGN